MLGCVCYGFFVGVLVCVYVLGYEGLGVYRLLVFVYVYARITDKRKGVSVYNRG